MPSGYNHHCKKCGYDWVGRKEMPRACPSCNTHKWNDECTRRTCCNCGKEWSGRKEDMPKKCPNCNVSNWDVSSFRLQCRRCGYEWSSRGRRSSSETAICPSCKTGQWMNTPPTAVCSRCHCRYVPHKLSKSDICPKCASRSPDFTLKCPFCDSEWISKKEGWAVCPFCGFKKPSDPDSIRRVWSGRGRCLKYVREGDFEVVYLWKGSKPVAAMNLDSIHDAGFDLDDRGCLRLARYLEDHADDCMEKNRELEHMLNLSEQDYLFLAYHFDGMSPEALALKFDTDLETVRRSFDRIMGAFTGKGIPVNDNKYTEDPQAEYDRYMNNQKCECR